MIRPKWFVPVACVIFYRSNFAGIEFLLGKRKEKETEGGKWGLVGGTGAFWEGAESPIDFAKREAVYDLNIAIESERLVYFTDEVGYNPKSLILEVYFSYELEVGQEVEITGNDKAPDACGWFSLREIKKMAERKEIAFNNDKTIELFKKQILYDRKNI